MINACSFRWLSGFAAAALLSLPLTALRSAESVPTLSESSAITTGKPQSANTASKTKVDPNSGVVVDLNAPNQDMAVLAPVVYNDQQLTVQNYAASGGAGGIPANLQGKMIRLSITDAEMLALNYSWNIKKAMTQRLQARAKKLNAVGQALPSVQPSMNWGGTQSNATPGEYGNSATNRLGVSVSASQPLFLGGKVVAAYKEAELFNDFVSEDIRRVRLATIYTIRNQYYLGLVNLKQMNIYKEQMDIAQEYWEKTKRRYEADDVAEIDVLRYEVDYKIQKAQYIQASNNYNVSIADLLRLLGLPLDTTVELSDPFSFLDITPGNEKNLTAEALSTRPELKQAQLNEQMQQKKIWQEKSELFPKVYGVAGWDNANDYYHAYEKRLNTWDWSAGVQVKWDALVGGGQLIRASVMNAEAILEQYKFTTSDTVDQIKQEVKDSLLNLSSSIDWVKSQQENVTQATRVLKQQTIRWDEGAGAYLDILDARDKLAQTQLLYWQGIYNYKTAIVSLDYAVGRFNSNLDNQVKGYAVRRDAATPQKKLPVSRTPEQPVREKVLAPANSQKLLEEAFSQMPVPQADEARKAPAEQVQPALISENMTRQPAAAKPMPVEQPEFAAQEHAIAQPATGGAAGAEPAAATEKSEGRALPPSGPVPVY